MVSTRKLIAAGDEEISADLLIPQNGSVDRLALLVHGGPGGVKEGPSNLYVDIAEQLANAGIASVRFDFLGAGESSGSYERMTITSQAEELRAVIEYVRSHLQPRSIALVGESYGGTISILGLGGTKFSALVLLWPAIWLLDNTFQSFVTPEKMKLAAKQGYIEEEGERIGLPFLKELIAVENVSSGLDGVSLPTLFVHGTADQEVPYQQSVRAAELLSGPKKVLLVPDGDHCLEQASEREIVYREVVDWLAEYA